jgi:hypothetical protein
MDNMVEMEFDLRQGLEKPIGTLQVDKLVTMLIETLGK